MKTLKYIFSTLFLLTVLSLTSCGGKESPAAKYAAIMNTVIDEIEKCQTMEELTQVINNPEERELTVALVEDNKDYVLTDSDKEKLMQVNDRLTEVMMHKTMELNNMPPEVKDAMESQLKAQVEEINNFIKSCNTLGDIGAM